MLQRPVCLFGLLFSSKGFFSFTKWDVFNVVIVFVSPLSLCTSLYVICLKFVSFELVLIAFKVEGGWYVELFVSFICGSHR